MFAITPYIYTQLFLSSSAVPSADAYGSSAWTTRTFSFPPPEPKCICTQLPV